MNAAPTVAGAGTASSATRGRGGIGVTAASSEPPPGSGAFRSIPRLLLASAGARGPKAALVDHRGAPDSVVTYEALGRAVEEVALGLDALGIGPGDRVAILSSNRPEWPICDLAIMALGGVTIPLHHVLPPNQVEYILRDSGARAAVVEGAAEMATIDTIAGRCPALDRVVLLAPPAAGRMPVSYDEVRAAGRDRRAADPGLFEHRLDALEPDALCSIVYTSGTTGEPKGVMLHHRGFLTVVLASEPMLGLREDDVFLSFLPLSHLYERVAGHWCALYRGCTIAYARDVGTVLDDMARVRPTVMVSVPRVYEKLRGRVETAAAAAGPVARRLFRGALATGRRYQAARAAGRAGLGLTAANGVAERLVFRKIRDKLGGRFRFPISGGAPLSVDTLDFFEAMGFHIVEGYGMTETHLIITLTPAGRTRRGSCGRPIPGVEVGVAADGEVLVRGDTVMRGYHHRDDLTRETIDTEGWLHTGDIGRLDEDGYLYITDRKKNLIVTAGGKNVAPAPIENALKSSAYIEEVCLVGDRRQFIAAVVVPDFAVLDAWARDHGLDPGDRDALVASPAVNALVMAEIRARQSDSAPYERVRKCVVLAEPFTFERGEFTPSLKVRRRVVEEHFAAQIEETYAAG
jgi:long-chain acyl-CoA synthetase